MSQHKKNFSGIKVAQKPGVESIFTLDWVHKQEPVKKSVLGSQTSASKVEEKNPEKGTVFEQKVIEKAGNTQKSNGVRISNPPGGKSNFTFG